MALTRNSAASRTAALGVLAAFLLVVGVGAGLPLVAEYRLTVAHVEHSRSMLGAYERIARREAVLRRGRDSLARARSLDGLLLPPGSDGAAIAALQNRLQSIVRDAGASLSSVQALPAVTEDRHRRIGLRVQFAANVDSLRTIFHALEYGRPAMVLDDLSIRARSSRAVGVDNPLEVRVDVFALMPEGA